MFFDTLRALLLLFLYILRTLVFVLRVFFQYSTHIIGVVLIYSAHISAVFRYFTHILHALSTRVCIWTRAQAKRQIARSQTSTALGRQVRWKASRASLLQEERKDALKARFCNSVISYVINKEI